MGTLAKKSRKTIDKTVLVDHALCRINRLGRLASDALFDGNTEHAHRLIGAQQELGNLLHGLDIYNGYNSRMWHAFCRQQGWLDIVHKLGKIDNETGSKHYWHLLSLLDRRMRYPPKEYYGCESVPPTRRELARAKRIAERYCQVLFD